LAFAATRVHARVVRPARRERLASRDGSTANLDNSQCRGDGALERETDLS